jgi:torulene dioxygenase
MTNFLSNVLPAAFVGAQVVLADLPATAGPPPDSDPLTWGFYATHEVPEATQLEIFGTIPSWVSGSLYRGAAATWDVGNYTAEHWFDGFSRNHRFEIADGGVSYRSRNASDELSDFVRETGLYPNGNFGSDPCKIIFGAFETSYRDGNDRHGDKSTSNVNVAWAPNFAGVSVNTSSDVSSAPFDTLIMTTDANKLHQLDPVTLEPIELFTYQASSPLLVNSGRSAAHPIVGEDGTIFNYVLDLEQEPPTYHVFRISPPEGETKIMASITDAPPAYIHSMFGTEKHIILIVWQADLTQQGKTVLSSIGPWNPNRKALFYVVDRENGGLVGKYESPDTFFAFHEINSFEDEEGNIFIDLPRMDDDGFLNAAKVTSLRANLGSPNATSKQDLSGAFTRYRLPHISECGSKKTPATNSTSIPWRKAEIDFSLDYKLANLELPRINPTNQGRPYRYAYGIHTETTGYFADSIIKIDTELESWKVWEPETRHLPSEPVFIGRPGAEAEDDGVLVTVAMDAVARRSSLVFLDAQTLTEIARAKMPIVMGYGFHGAWGNSRQ